MFSYAEKFFPNKLFSCYFAPKYNRKKKNLLFKVGITFAIFYNLTYYYYCCYYYYYYYYYYYNYQK